MEVATSGRPGPVLDRPGLELPGSGRPGACRGPLARCGVAPGARGRRGGWPRCAAGPQAAGCQSGCLGQSQRPAGSGKPPAATRPTAQERCPETTTPQRRRMSQGASGSLCPLDSSGFAAGAEVSRDHPPVLTDVLTFHPHPTTQPHPSQPPDQPEYAPPVRRIDDDSCSVRQTSKLSYDSDRRRAVATMHKRGSVIPRPRFGTPTPSRSRGQRPASH